MSAAYASLLQTVTSFTFWPAHWGVEARANPWQAANSADNNEVHMVGGYVANYSHLSEEELDGVDAECVAHMNRSKLLFASEEL